MSQPDWKTVCHVGDSNPVDYSGGFVQVDQTGVYAPECTWIEAGESETDPVTVYRFILEPCTYVNGILSDNRFHPDKPAWFAKHVEGVAMFKGDEPQNVIDQFCNPDPTDSAWAWIDLGQYAGFDNLDSYPLTMTPDECREWLKGKA